MRTRNGQNVKRCPLIKLSAPNKQEYSYNLLLITITQKQRQDGLEIPLFKMTSQTRPFLKIFLFELNATGFFFTVILRPPRDWDILNCITLTQHYKMH
jgi:hypothetical protein